MATTVIPLAQLLAADMWKADSFVSRQTAHTSSAYPMVAVSEVVHERREFLDPSEFPDHEFWYLGLEHVTPHTGDVYHLAPRKGREVLSKSKVFRDGDVLYGRLRPYLNKVFAAASPVAEGICSGEFLVLVPESSRVLPGFLRALLASRFVRDSITGLHTGSALPRLQLSDLLRCRVPLPPVEIQRQLSSSLRHFAEQRQRAALLLEQQPALLEDQLCRALGAGLSLDHGSVEPAVAQSHPPCALPPSYRPARRQRTQGLDFT